MIDNQLKISVIIPVYNTAKYLPRCLESILNNNYQNIEVICINDGSTDDSLSVLKEFELRDQRIKIINCNHRGVSFARNEGLENAIGDFVSFVDSDDWIHPCFFSVLMYWQKKYNADIVSSSMWNDMKDNSSEFLPINPKGLSAKHFDNDRALNNHLVRCLVWSKIFRREIIENIRFVNNLKIGEDACFNLDCYKANENMKTVIVDCKIYYYYFRNVSSSHSDRLKKSIVQYEFFLQKIIGVEDKGKYRWYLYEILHRCIDYRYRCERDNDLQTEKEFQEIIERCIKLEKAYKILPFSKSCLFRFLAKFPFVFRIYKNLKRKFK